MTQRQLFRLISYALLGILLVFLLIVYSLYLSAQRMPGFYKENLSVSDDRQQLRNTEMRHKVIELNNAVQTTAKTWAVDFSDETLNGYCAVELVREEANLLPPEITEPRLSFSDRQVDVACRVDQGNFSGILHLTLGIEVPEPNRISLRIKNARLGTLPISRDIPRKLIVEALERKGYEVRQGEAGGDPVLSFTVELKYGTDKKVNLESLIFTEGTVRISGETEKVKPEDGRHE